MQMRTAIMLFIEVKVREELINSICVNVRLVHASIVNVRLEIAQQVVASI